MGSRNGETLDVGCNRMGMSKQGLAEWKGERGAVWKVEDIGR